MKMETPPLWSVSLKKALSQSFYRTWTCFINHCVISLVIFRLSVSSSDRRTMSSERKWKKIISSGIETWNNYGELCFTCFFLLLDWNIIQIQSYFESYSHNFPLLLVPLGCLFTCHAKCGITHPQSRRCSPDCFVLPLMTADYSFIFMGKLLCCFHF